MASSQTTIMQAMGPTRGRADSTKMVGGLPSPTLTNPDMVLPDEPLKYPMLSSPSRNAWRERPPSPSYLRDTPPESVRARSSSGGSSMATPKKEKRGLMSRKMMLLRSRTASNSNGLGLSAAAQSISSEGGSENYDPASGGAPALMDIGNLAPEQVPTRRTSTGENSAGSDDMNALPQFLAKYQTNNAPSVDDDWEGESVGGQRYGNSASLESGLDAQRRQQEEDEHNSAILSKRAEQILANAKKRLNLMEGNLRGARDLVQPLTAANLKRATSVGSSALPTGGNSMRGRYIHDGYQYEPSLQAKQRKLQAQASSPAIGQDYSGHSRGFSETGITNRPHTSLERTNTPNGVPPRLPIKASEPSWSGLRASRSQDSLGAHAVLLPSPRDNPYARGSPDPNLGPLVEDDSPERTIPVPRSRFADQKDSYDAHDPSSRSSSRTEGLKEQMSSLKGKISSLKERAREDSLRRQSMQNMREPSPLNNAAVNAPEFFYTQSQTYGSPVLDANAGVGWSSPNDSPHQRQQSTEGQLQPVRTGSRNAFAEDPQYRQRDTQTTSNGSQQLSLHKRTPSGTAIVESSKHRYSHHEIDHRRNASGDSTYEEAARVMDGYYDVPNDDLASQSELSVYEDAESNQAAPIVAHEDREDAIDYQQFWLTTALNGAYSNERRDSLSSEGTESSVETARGPTRTGAEMDVVEILPPGRPETPERLREIERNIHKRALSNESVSTVATFATATEGGRSSSRPTSSRQISNNWPIPRSEPTVRPATAIPIKRPTPLNGLPRRDSFSDRADSGVGLPHRPNSSQSSKRSPLKSATLSSTLSPPVSPPSFADPATVAVNAVLNPEGRQLGLRDKALLFSLVESLRTVCQQLQERGDGDFESRALRRRLDDARKILNGAMS